MRPRLAREPGRGIEEQRNDLAPGVEPGVVVVIELGSRDAEARKDNAAH